MHRDDEAEQLLREVIEHGKKVEAAGAELRRLLWTTWIAAGLAVVALILSVIGYML